MLTTVKWQIKIQYSTQTVTVVHVLSNVDALLILSVLLKNLILFYFI